MICECANNVGRTVWPYLRQGTLRPPQLQPLLLQSLQQTYVNCSKPAHDSNGSAYSNGSHQQESESCLHRRAAVPCLTSHDCLQLCFQGGCRHNVLAGKLQSSKQITAVLVAAATGAAAVAAAVAAAAAAAAATATAQAKAKLPFVPTDHSSNLGRPRFLLCK